MVGFPALLNGIQYNRFWEDPAATPASWLGLLFSLFCLATQLKNPEIRISNKSQPAVLPYNTTTPALIQCYREKIVQSLVLAQFSRGGSFIVETLIHYLVVEQFLRRDSDPGIWLLLGNLVQIGTSVTVIISSFLLPSVSCVFSIYSRIITRAFLLPWILKIPSAMRMGYHREASHFRNISIYEGEMRRRVWMTIYQIDLNVSTQLGMPRIIKDSTTDTLEPRNLSDSDFDANSTVLPPSRSDTDPMPMLFLIAKARIVSAFSIVSDLVTNPRPYSYAQVLKIDTTLNGAHANLPEPCRVRSLSQSIMDSPNIISLVSTENLYMINTV